MKKTYKYKLCFGTMLVYLGSFILGSVIATYDPQYIIYLQTNKVVTGIIIIMSALTLLTGVMILNKINKKEDKK